MSLLVITSFKTAATDLFTTEAQRYTEKEGQTDSHEECGQEFRTRILILLLLVIIIAGSSLFRYRLRLRRAKSDPHTSWLIAPFPNRMLKLQNRKIQLDRCFRSVGFQIIIQNLGNQFPATLHESFLLCIIPHNRQRLDRAGQLPDFRKRFDDHQRRDGRLPAF